MHILSAVVSTWQEFWPQRGAMHKALVLYYMKNTESDLRFRDSCLIIVDDPLSAVQSATCRRAIAEQLCSIEPLWPMIRAGIDIDIDSVS